VERLVHSQRRLGGLALASVLLSTVGCRTCPLLQTLERTCKRICRCFRLQTRTRLGTGSSRTTPCQWPARCCPDNNPLGTFCTGHSSPIPVASSTLSATKQNSCAYKQTLLHAHCAAQTCQPSAAASNRKISARHDQGLRVSAGTAECVHSSPESPRHAPRATGSAFPAFHERLLLSRQPGSRTAAHGEGRLLRASKRW
jgi:hypothetical protein